MKRGSVNWKLNQLKPGKHLYLDTTFKTARVTQRRIHVPANRRPESMSGWKFATTVLTVIPTGKLAKPCYLVKVKRIR